MRELIGYLVACRGAEQAAVPIAVGVPQQFLHTGDRAGRVHATIDDEPSRAAIAFARIAVGRGVISDSIREIPDDLGLMMGACRRTLMSARSSAPIPTDSARTGTPITTVYARENFTTATADDIAGAIPGFGVLD
jgi:hypothetical protein